MHYQNTHLCCLVVGKQVNAIGGCSPFVRIVRTAINLASIARCHAEMVVEFNTIVAQSNLYIAVQFLEIHAFCQRQRGRRIQNRIDDLVHQVLSVHKLADAVAEDIHPLVTHIKFIIINPRNDAGTVHREFLDLVNIIMSVLGIV